MKKSGETPRNDEQRAAEGRILLALAKTGWREIRTPGRRARGALWLLLFLAGVFGPRS